MKRLLLLSLILVITLTACGTQSSPQIKMTESASVMSVDGAAPGVPQFRAASDDMAFEAPAVDTFQYDAAGNTLNAQDRLVIQNVDMAVVVPEPETSIDDIARMAEQMGGFVVSVNLYQTYLSNNIKIPEGHVVIRVPAEKLDEALEKIEAAAVEVQSKNRTGTDVTEQYVDLRSRLKAKQVAESKLLDIMSKAEKTEDVLNVFNQLTHIQTEIESLKGQIQYYEQAAALSVISVRVIAEETIQPLEIAGWKPVGVARDALQALVNFFQGFVDFLIWLVITIIPAGILILLVLWPLWKLIRFLWKNLFSKKTKTDQQKVEKDIE